MNHGCLEISPRHSSKKMAGRIGYNPQAKDLRRAQFQNDDNSTLIELVPEARPFSPKIQCISDDDISSKSRIELQRDCLDSFNKQCKLNLLWHKKSSEVSLKTHYIKNAVYKVEQANKKLVGELDKFMNEIESFSGKTISTHDTINSVSKRLVSFAKLIKKGFSLSQKRTEIQSKYISIYENLPDIQSSMIMKDKSKQYQLDRLRIFESEECRLENIVKINQDQLDEYGEFINVSDSLEAEIFHAIQYLQLLHYEVNYLNIHFKIDQSFHYSALELKELTEKFKAEEDSESSTKDNIGSGNYDKCFKEVLSLKTEPGNIFLIQDRKRSYRTRLFRKLIGMEVMSV